MKPGPRRSTQRRRWARETYPDVRRIVNLPHVTCAALSYLEKNSEPKTLDDRREHVAVNYVSSNTGRMRS